MGIGEARRRAERVIGRAFPDIASDVASGAAAVVGGPAAGAASGVGARAIFSAVGERRFAEITADAIVQTVLASVELCDDPLLTYEGRDHGVSAFTWTMPWLTLRQLAAAISNGTFAPRRTPDAPPMYSSGETSHRWSRVADDIERARRTFVAEL